MQFASTLLKKILHSVQHPNLKLISTPIRLYDRHCKFISKLKKKKLISVVAINHLTFYQ